MPAAPSAPAKPLVTIGSVNVTPKMAAIGGIALAAILVGAYLFMNMNSKPGSLTFSPSTISCSSPVSFTVTAHLPASLKSTDTISLWFDGKSAGSTPIGESGSDVNQQPDGTPSSVIGMYRLGNWLTNRSKIRIYHMRRLMRGRSCRCF